LTVEDYEIRLLSSGGGTALLFATHCVSDAHAREVAHQMCTDEYAGYEIWHGQLCVEKHFRVRGR
jgi:hypothetical protein